MVVMEAGAVPRVASPMVPTLTPRLLRLASDARLVGFVRDGREGAFETIYDRHSRGIYAFCRHMLGDADEAEDAVQHTFMAAYTDLCRSDRTMHLRAWLFTIARNRCFSMLRARREQPSDAIEEAVAEGVAAQVQRRQDLRDLVHDMRRLPDEQRAALVLAEIDALTHTEIADVLGVPREKVKALVFQARESLVASRNARDTACSEIREQIACGRGASLRRANLRRHLRECDGCRAFRAQVQQQRKQFALLLPVGPTLAVKEALFGASAAGGGAAALGTGVLASGALKSGVAKGLVGAVLTAIGTAGGVMVATTSHMHSLLDEVSSALSVPAPSGGHASRADRTATSTRSTAHAPVSSSTAPGMRALASGGVAGSGLGVSSWGGGATTTRSATTASTSGNGWNDARQHGVGRRHSSPDVHRILHSRSAAAPAAPSAPATSVATPVIRVTPVVHGRQQASGSDSQNSPGASGSAPGHSQYHGRGGDSAGSDSNSPGNSGGAGSQGDNGAPGNSGNAPGHAGVPTGDAGPSAGPGPTTSGPGPGAPGGSGNAPGQTGDSSGSGSVQTQSAPGNSGNAPGHAGGQGNGSDGADGQAGPGNAGHGHSGG